MAEEIAATEDEQRELGTKPVPQLFAKYAITTFAGFIAMIIMVIAEGIMLSIGLGSHGLAATAIVMTIEFTNLAINGCMGMGTSTLAGNAMGEGDDKRANSYFNQGFWLTVIITVTLSVIGLIFTPQLAAFFGATPDILDDSIIGIRAYLVAFPFAVLGQLLGYMLRVDEKPQLFAIFSTTASILCIIWLALSLFVFHLGLAAVGLYYAFSSAFLFFSVFYFLRKGGTFSLHIKGVRIEKKVTIDILKIGMPMFFVQFASVVYQTVMNNQLGTLGSSLDIAVFSILSGYILYVINIMVGAITYAVQPIASFNTGAKAYGRLKQLLKVSLFGQVGTILAVSVLVFIFADPICGAFSGGDLELKAAAVHATRIIILAAAFGFSAQTMSSYFECTEHVVVATVLSLSRYVFFLTPAVYIMGSMMGIEGVWWALPVADVITFLFTLIFFVREERRLTAIEKSEAANNAVADEVLPASL